MVTLVAPLAHATRSDQLLIIVATLATAEVPAGAGAEADQNFKIVALLLLGYFWLVIKIKKKNY